MQTSIAPTPKNGSALKVPMITDQPVNMVYITTMYEQFKTLTDNEVNALPERRSIQTAPGKHLQLEAPEGKQSFIQI